MTSEETQEKLDDVVLDLQEDILSRAGASDFGDGAVSGLGRAINWINKRFGKNYETEEYRLRECFDAGNKGPYKREKTGEKIK